MGNEMSLYKTSADKTFSVKITLLSTTVLSLLIAHTTALAAMDDSIEKALKFGQADDAKYGQIKFNLRYRYENDDSKAPDKTVGNASTVRLRLGYLTPEFHSFQIFAEYEGNQDVGANTYNSLRNGHDTYETIADPQQHELNQFWLSYNGLPDTKIKLGRQHITLNNQRFIGDQDWRQMQRTFDALTITNKSLHNTTIHAGYITSVRDVTAEKIDMDSQFINAGYDFKRIGTLSAYTYLLGFNDRPTDNIKSSQTYGVRFNGGATINDDVSTIFTSEYAYQQDYANNPDDYEADYALLIAGLNAYGFIVKGAVEQLGGKGAGPAFQTPLASDHYFNGWSDQFTVIPVNGLRDTYGSIGTTVMGIDIEGIYHDFTDDTGKIDYGEEWDFMAVKTFGKHYSLLAKYAYYDDNGALTGLTDTHNFWLQAEVSF
jgi:hypothetical protein